MADIRFRSDVRVDLIRHVGSDLDIARAAWVCEPQDTRGVEEPEAVRRVIHTMMKGRHGAPFESGQLAFYVEAPIFVFREWHRHRIGFSYNEVSGRYRILDPEFYVPPPDRPCLEPLGFKPMRPELECHSDGSDFVAMTHEMEDAYAACWTAYQLMIGNRVAREVARSVLPVGTYSAMQVTCNPRSLMHFLSLRTRSADATVKSYPQWEIEQAAVKMEAEFARLWPETHKSFVANGRVAP